MRFEDVRGYVQRDWRAIGDAKENAWLELRRTRGIEGALALADELWRQASELQPDWPSQDERAEDLAVHVRVAEALRRARGAGSK